MKRKNAGSRIMVVALYIIEMFAMQKVSAQPLRNEVFVEEGTYTMGSDAGSKA